MQASDQQLTLVACRQCGHPMDLTRTSDYCCRECYDRSYYRRNRELILAKRRERYATDPAYRNKIQIHIEAQAALPIDQDAPPACERCGAPARDRHHPDDAQPTLIELLCRPCHVKHHAAGRKRKNGSTTHASI